MIRPAHAEDSPDAPLWQWGAAGFVIGGLLMSITVAILVAIGSF